MIRRVGSPIGVGVIGCGYWGPNHVRNFSRHPDFRVLVVCDVRAERAAQVAREFNVPSAVTDATAVISDRAVSLVVIATPTGRHFELAKAALLAGKHVLVMKPMTARVDHAEELVQLARRRGLLLAVDHTFLFTGAVRKMRELLIAGEIGEIYYIDSVRINLGLFQSDVNVIWDLAAHDVSIIDHLLGGELPREVSAVGAAHAGSPTENVAYVTLRFGDNLLAHVHANWLAPAKVRRTIIGGSKRMIIYDDTHPSEKLLVYDKGVSISRANGTDERADGEAYPYEHRVSYRSGDMFAPRLDDREALATEVDHLAECLRTGQIPLADGLAGLRTVRVLDAAQRSLAMGSEPVTLSDAQASRSGLASEGREPGHRRLVALPIVAHGTTTSAASDSLKSRPRYPLDMTRSVLILGKGTLAIRIARWFSNDERWVVRAVVPVQPEPRWTRSLSAWARSEGIPVVESGRAEDALAVGPGWNRAGPRVDLAFSVFYDRILRPSFLAAASRTLNLHNGPLPRYRGVSPINWALRNGEVTHGVTIHEVSPGIDEGPIVAQTTYSIYPEFDEVIDVYRRALDYGWVTFVQTMPILDRIAARPQIGEASYYSSSSDSAHLGERGGFTVAEALGSAATPRRQRYRA